ncbi:MAG: serine/threonine protein kinase [Deltaproteobacteria bacterium]|nr:serine/threonine protein kinase [Deltaproteobacteria bacterium]
MRNSADTAAFLSDSGLQVVHCGTCGAEVEVDKSCERCGAPAPDRHLGCVIDGRYRVDALLGRGGMGAVYCAWHLSLGEAVAVKFLLAEHVARPELRERFRREAQVLSKLRHPGIVTVLDFGDHEGELYIAMELLRGRALDVFVGPGRQRLKVNAVVDVIDQLLQVLEAAHAHGVVHRDLKPENVMLLDDRGRVKVLDFGIAAVDAPGAGALRLSATGTVRGTPYYMSPEQCTGRGVGPSSDIYAAGVMLYELLTGLLPFEGTSVAEVMAQQMFTAPPRFAERTPGLELPAALEALCMHALAKKPEQRPTAAGFREGLAAAVGGADPLDRSAHNAAERARVAGLGRAERALRSHTAPTSTAPPPAADESGAAVPVALWGFGRERASLLRSVLGMQGMVAVEWSGEGPPAPHPDGVPWRCVLLPGTDTAEARTRLCRADARLGRTPVVVLDARDPLGAAALIRAGASDVALGRVDDLTACQKVLRAVRRGR